MLTAGDAGTRSPTGPSTRRAPGLTGEWERPHGDGEGIDAPLRDDRPHAPAQLLVRLIYALANRGHARRRADLHRILGDLVPRDTIDAAADLTNAVLSREGRPLVGE